MPEKYLLDTDIFIDYFRGDSRAIEFIKKNIDRINISVITVTELYAGARENEQEKLEVFIDLFPILPVDKNIAKLGGIFKNKYKPAHGIGLGDAIIASTAYNHGLTLKTNNIKHFPMFGLEGVYNK